MAGIATAASRSMNKVRANTANAPSPAFVCRSSSNGDEGAAASASGVDGAAAGGLLFCSRALMAEARSLICSHRESFVVAASSGETSSTNLASTAAPDAREAFKPRGLRIQPAAKFEAALDAKRRPRPPRETPPHPASPAPP